VIFLVQKRLRRNYHAPRFTDHFDARNIECGNARRSAMRNGSLAIFVLLTMLSSSALAIDTPRVISRSDKVEHPIDQVFGTLQQYFNDSSLSGFRLTNADKKSWTLVATRTDIDGANWNKWAFCKTSPEQMIYRFEGGTVTVTVELQNAGKDATFTTISADFHGNYGLGSQETTIDCVSKGELETDLIAVAGGSPKVAP